MLSHRIRPVSEILAPHVEHLWVVRGYLAARWRNMILPDGAMELIVNLGDPQKLCAQDSPAKHTLFRHSWISGERTTHHPSEIRPHEISWALLPRQRRVRLLERRHQQH
jgi:hypothetical protein